MRPVEWACCMTECAARFLIRLLATLVSVAVISGLAAREALDPIEAGAPRAIERIEFCVAASPDPRADCDWSVVDLPHRWRPRADTGQWGRYRIVLSGMPSVAHALVLSGLSPNGQLIAPGGALSPVAPSQRLPGLASNAYTRYQPQWFMFYPVKEDLTRLEIISSGNVAAAKGLRAMWVAEAEAATAIRDKRWWLEVVWPMALAAAAALAGAFSLVAGRGPHLTARVSRLLGALGILIAIRIAMNQVVLVPIDLAYWSRLSIGLLMLIDLLYCLPVIAYLRQSSRSVEGRALWLAFGAALLPWLIPDAQLLSVAILIFSLIALVAMAIFAWLAARVVRAPEPLGVALLITFGGALSAGVLDLLHRFSLIGTQFDSFQRFSSPILLVAVTILLMRENLARHKLETQLVSETQRREGLLRDLHDGVGSRLVALAFRARRNRIDPAITKGIDELLRELQLIQQTVRNDPANLGDLLAEIRKHYSDWSETEPLMRWEVDESIRRAMLSPERAIATLRIIQEAIANAIRHGDPRTITVRAVGAGAHGHPEVCVFDDGRGAFQVGPHGGLRNMLARAQGSGLKLSFDFLPGSKMVRIEYPKVP